MTVTPTVTGPSNLTAAGGPRRRRGGRASGILTPWINWDILVLVTVARYIMRENLDILCYMISHREYLCIYELQDIMMRYHDIKWYIPVYVSDESLSHGIYLYIQVYCSI